MRSGLQPSVPAGSLIPADVPQLGVSRLRVLLTHVSSHDALATLAPNASAAMAFVSS